MSISFLTSPNWITPQIDFLIYLQNLRLYFDEKLDNLFLFITAFGEYFIPVIVISVFYWCCDIKKGIYLFLLFAFNIYLVQIFKMTACVYRPWVLSSDVHPSPKAILHAGGYSFPSGHSSMSSSFWGGIAFLTRKKKFLPVLFVLLILLVGFSRMFLGVHTPQDVLTGFSIGLFLVFVTAPLVNWLEYDKKRYFKVLFLLDLFLIFALFYVLNKHYPVDYLNHKILVLPAKAIHNSIISWGLSAGIINGLFLFRALFDIDIENCSKIIKVIRGVIGLILLSVIFIFFVDKSFGVADKNWFTFLKLFSAGFFITFIYPLFFKLIK